jgi:2-polyprenyl-3-methyl-5-hydroxy-6-metoxy-1,4-benzoquinol methylase
MTKFITKLGWQLLEHPIIYRGFRFLFESEKFCKHYTSVTDVKQEDRILDIECGTGDILNSLPHVQYGGFDINEKYIATAKRRFKGQGEFVCAGVHEYIICGQNSFDIVLAAGVLHHLDDSACTKLFLLAHKSLRPRGRLITLDGLFTPEQSCLEAFFFAKDRGRFVGQEKEYIALAKTCFTYVKSIIRSGQIRLPFSHIALECRK